MVCIMSSEINIGMNKCINCKTWIKDSVELCPLCNSVLAPMQEALEESENFEIENDFLKLVGEGAPYPDVRKRKRTLAFFMKLILFLFIVVEAGLIVVNKIYLAKANGIWWSGICGVAMIYSYICMVYWLKHDSGHATKIGWQLFFTILLVVAIDYFTGMSGWSLQFAVPCIVLAGDAIVFILMMTDRRQWYSYTLLLLILALLCGGIIFCYIKGYITHVLLVYISVGVTFVYLLATFIFGDRIFMREMKRRFRM